MITCKRCGRPAPVGLASCQYCGMPLTNTAGEGTGSGMISNMPPEQSQPELPAWLETLRSSERPSASAGAADFSAGSFMDEGALPSWMRPEGQDIADNSPSGKYPAYPGLRPASMPAPNTDGTFPPTGGMSASSLIDEQALPPWLQGEQRGGQENIAAASLVQPEALPEWIKTMQPPAPVYPDPMYSAQPIPPQGIMGNDLIDRQVLPPWMSGQDSPASSGSEAGLAGSSLLDANALPSWLREVNQEQQRTGGSGAAFLPPVQPGQIPMNQPPSYNQPMPAMNGNLSAASFIDVNALPDWLRPAEEQRQNAAFAQQQQGFAGNAGQASYSPPGSSARPENVRVPSRPRGEMGSYEESEVAANVFASVLGVASGTPHFPGQGDAYGRPQIPPQSQQNMPQQQAGGAVPGTFGTPGMPPGYAGMPPAQMNVQAPGGYAMGSVPGMPANGMPPQQVMPANVVGMQPGPTMNNSSAAPKPNAKPARRGFLSTILDWFSR